MLQQASELRVLLFEVADLFLRLALCHRSDFCAVLALYGYVLLTIVDYILDKERYRIQGFFDLNLCHSMCYGKQLILYALLGSHLTRISPSQREETSQIFRACPTRRKILCECYRGPPSLQSAHCPELRQTTRLLPELMTSHLVLAGSGH